MRDNILFGKAYDKAAYKKVVEACALEHDLAMWEHGDQTLVGERGVALSGGQKARVTLARAIYRLVESEYIQILNILWVELCMTML